MVTERKKQRVAIKTVREILLDVSRSIKRQKVYRLSVFERQRATAIVERENERERERKRVFTTLVGCWRAPRGDLRRVFRHLAGLPSPPLLY